MPRLASVISLHSFSDEQAETRVQQQQQLLWCAHSSGLDSTGNSRVQYFKSCLYKVLTSYPLCLLRLLCCKLSSLFALFLLLLFSSLPRFVSPLLRMSPIRIISPVLFQFSAPLFLSFFFLSIRKALRN